MAQAQMVGNVDVVATVKPDYVNIVRKAAVVAMAGTDVTCPALASSICRLACPGATIGQTLFFGPPLH